MPRQQSKSTPRLHTDLKSISRNAKEAVQDYTKEAVKSTVPGMPSKLSKSTPRNAKEAV